MRYESYLIHQDFGVKVDNLGSEISLETCVLSILSLLKIQIFNFRVSCDDD